MDFWRSRPWAFLLASLLSFARITAASGSDLASRADGLDLQSHPSLFTGQFGDCLDGESLFNVTSFDTAYYADERLVLMYLEGKSNIRSEDVMRECTPPCTCN